MGAHYWMGAMAGICVAAGVAAEPSKAPVRKAEQPIEQPAPVVAASANVERPETTDASDAQAEAPAKPRRARVTSCRCGDQTPSN